MQIFPSPGAYGQAEKPINSFYPDGGGGELSCKEVPDSEVVRCIYIYLALLAKEFST
jgi:hypothetical protein